MAPRTLTLGRDPACDITLADESISRRHAHVTLLDDGTISVRDLGSQNGTFVVRDGARRALESAILRASDDVVFGDLELPCATLLEIATERLAGAEPPFSRQPTAPEESSNARPDADPAGAGWVEFLPLVGGIERIHERGMLVPAILFAAFLTALVGALGEPIRFVNTLGVGITLGALLFVYRLAGKRKPWFMFAAVMAVEAFILSYLIAPFIFVFRTATGAGGLLDAEGVVSRFLGHFSGAGLMEELMKMIPVFALIVLTRRSARADRGSWGVIEPLDAIVYACAAAAMFVIIETLQQYVPINMEEVFEDTDDAFRAVLSGGQLAIIRTLSSLTGHLAYSGYFGYFVGLGLLRPDRRTGLWLGGWIGSSLIHGLSNATLAWPFVSLVLDIVAFLFLVAVIVNARKISPTRHENFATMFVPKER